MKGLRGSAGAALVSLALTLGGARLAAGASIEADLLEAPAFSAAPAVLQELGAAHADDDPKAVVLVQEAALTIDGERRVVYRHRQVYRVNSAAGVADWSKADMVWAPWYQDPPSVRARVVSAAGREHWLDPATVAEVPLEEGDDEVLSDRRRKVAPLPAVAAGSVVEVEWVRRDRRPLFAAGKVSLLNARLEAPIVRERMVVDAPRGLPFHFATPQLGELAPRREERGERTRWTFDLEDEPAYGDFIPYLPSDVSEWALILVGTGESWQTAAAEYGRVVDGQIAGAELGPVLAAAVTPGATRAQVIEELLEWLQGQVRYTGVEFGEAAIVPRPPAETLERRYGDCKDKATLLVALLRAAGIPAHVALLRTHHDFDVPPQLPGFGLFDHAIVYVPGDPETWIDPTAEFARAGELPSADQGRNALIAGPETAALVLTPVASADANVYRETREIELAKFGAARSRSTLVTRGTFELGHRIILGSLGDEGKKLFAKEMEKAGGRGSYMTDPHDLSEPFRIEGEQDRVEGAFTDLAWAYAKLDASTLLKFLPRTFVNEEADDDLAERTEDFELRDLYRAESDVRVVPPDGFVVGELPPGAEQELGPASFTRKVEEEPDGTVRVFESFEIDRRRLGADEARALRDGALALLRDPVTVVRFQQRGESLLAAGQVKKALDEFRRLPPYPLNRGRIARALLAAGLGDAAREEARAAVRAGPDEAMAWQSFGLVLMSDTLGRPFAPGWDRAGAEAAFRDAVELEPDLPGLRRNLAVVLEFNAAGRRYGAGARLDEAIAELRLLREQGTHDLDLNLLVDLFHAGHFEEAAKLAEEIGQTALRAAAIAAAEGPAAARERIQALGLDDAILRQTLQGAAVQLLAIRRYPEAAALFEASAQGAPNAALLLGQAGQLRQARHHEEVPLPATEPTSVAHRVLQAYLLDDATLLPPLADGVKADEVLPIFRAEVRALRSAATGAGLGEETLCDIVEAGATVDREGDPVTGYRLRATWSFGGSSLAEVFYVAPGPRGYELVAVSSSGVITPFAAQVSARLDSGDLAGARRWLDWARRECGAGGNPLDPVSICPLVTLSGSAAGELDAESLAEEAASLLAEGGSEAALEVLRRGWSTAEDPARRRAYGVALARAYQQLERGEEEATVASELLAADPDSDSAFVFLTVPLVKLGRWDELEAAANQRLARKPDDALALSALAATAQGRNDLARARDYWLRLAGTSGAAAWNFNNLAWIDICLDRVDETTRQRAERAVMLSGQNSSASLHTMAAVYAELGRITESRDLVYQAIAAPDSDGLESYDWYVFGRIAEHLGLPEEAMRAYRRVEAPDSPAELPVSTFALAARRLAALSAEEETPR